MLRFSTRERLAIVAVAVVILIGWSIRFAQWRTSRDMEMTLIRDAVPVPAASADAGSKRLQGDGFPLDINTASVEQLERLPMIGPAKATAIVGHREAHGAFETPASITEVTGIGPATYERIRDSITVVDRSVVGP